MPPIAFRLFALALLFAPAAVFGQEEKKKDAAPPPLPATTVTVSGVVFDDRNGDGKRQPDEPGLAGVWVSDGTEMKKTDADGRYAITVAVDKSRCVFVVIPGDRKLIENFWTRLEVGQTGEQKWDVGLPPRVAPKERTDAKATKFVQVTDVHCSTAEHGKWIAQDMQEVNRLDEPAEFVVSTGDLINQGTAAEFENYLSGMKVSRRPVRHVIGNHDYDNNKPGGRTLLYEKFFGPPYYAFEAADLHCVVLDSMKWDARQQEWLKWHMGTVPADKKIIVFQHYPPKKELLDLLAGYNVKGIFSGHVHGTRIAEYRGIFNCNSVTFKMGCIDRSPRGFQLVSVTAESVRSKQFLGGIDRQFSLAANEAGAAAPAAAADAPAVVPGADFAMAHGDAGSSGVAADAVAGPLKPAWSAYAGGIVHMGSPIVYDKKVYVGTLYVTGFENCGVTCLDAVTGKRLWRTVTDGCIKNTPAAADGRVYAVSLLGTAYCLDAASGQVIWKQTMGEPAIRWEIGAPKLVDGVLYAGTGNHLAALDAKTGAFAWPAKYVHATVAAGEKFLEKANVIHDDWWPNCYQSVAVGKDLVYLGGRTGLHAVDRKTGNVLKTRTVPQDAKTRSPALPTLAGGNVYAAFGKLVAFPADDPAGAALWVGEAVIGDETGTPAVAGGLVIVGTAAGTIVAADAKTGKTVWTVKTGKAVVSMLPYQRDESTVSSSPVVSGSVVYIGGNDGRLRALELKTGRELESHDIGVPICGSPAVSGNAVYVAGYDGIVRCFVGVSAKP